MNHFLTNTFRQLLSFLVINYKIVNKDGYTVGYGELHKACLEVYPRIAEYVTVYNECVQLISRLSPTLNTTFHLLLHKEYGKPLDLLRTAQLYKVKDMLLQRL